MLEISSTTPVKNVSVTRLVPESDGRSWRLAAFNDVRHLEEQDVPITQHPGERRPEPQHQQGEHQTDGR
jgi:hypothetical protein